MTGPLLRIFLRYLGVYLATKGFIGAQELTGDPELAALIEMGIGLAIAAGTEAWYALAKRFGWRT